MFAQQLGLRDRLIIRPDAAHKPITCTDIAPDAIRTCVLNFTGQDPQELKLKSYMATGDVDSLINRDAPQGTFLKSGKGPKATLAHIAPLTGLPLLRPSGSLRFQR